MKEIIIESGHPIHLGPRTGTSFCKTRRMPRYIFDTTTLSNFAVADRVGLLETRYREFAFTTVEVRDELQRGLGAGYGYLEAALTQIATGRAGGWIRPLAPDRRDEYLLRAELDQCLDPGETSCLALAVSRGLTLVTDDRAARRLARLRAVELTGTQGILVALVRDAIIPLSEANAVPDLMIERGYRSPVDSLDDLVRLGSRPRRSLPSGSRNTGNTHRLHRR